MKVYGTNSWGSNIEEKEIVKISGKSIYYLNRIGKENRELISSGSRHWYTTKEEAVNYLIDRTQRKIKSRKIEIQTLESELEALTTNK